jgi:DNA repair exonuclease SbcCD nuclease subunit
MTNSNIIIASDLHIFDWQEFANIVVYNNSNINSRLLMGLDVLKYILDTAQDRNIDTIYLLGDTFHFFDRLPTQVIMETTNILKQYPDIRKYILPGNHDKILFNGHCVLELLQQDPMTVVIMEPRRIEMPGSSYYHDFIPYYNHKEYKAAISSFEKPHYYNSNIILFSHIGLKGSIIGPMDYILDNELTVNDFPSWYNTIILGHIHRSQQLSSKIFYLGSPMQNVFGEGETIEKYIYEYDPENNKFTNIKVNAPKFITHLMYESDTDITLDDYNYYWLKVRDGVLSDKELDELRRLFNVRVDILPRELTKERIRIESEFPVTQMTLDYVKYKGETKEMGAYGTRIVKEVDESSGVEDD